MNTKITFNVEVKPNNKRYISLASHLGFVDEETCREIKKFMHDYNIEYVNRKFASEMCELFIVTESDELEDNIKRKFMNDLIKWLVKGNIVYKRLLVKKAKKF